MQEYLEKDFILQDIPFLREYVTLCWDIIGQGDELNYSISQLLTNLKTLSQCKDLAFILNDHPAPKGILILQGLFLHNMPYVRSIVYTFTLYVLDQLATMDSQVDLAQLSLHALQNLMFETETDKQECLASVVAKCVYIEDRQGTSERLHANLLVFFKLACTQDTKNMLKGFIWKSHKASIMSFYKQPMNFEEEQLMAYLRIYQLGRLLGRLLAMDLADKEGLQKNLVVRLRQINNYNVVMMLLLSDSRVFSPDNLVTLMQLDYFQIEREDLDQIKEQINKNCQLLLDVLAK